MVRTILIAALLAGASQTTAETLTLNDIQIYDTKSGKLYPSKTTFRETDLVITGPGNPIGAWRLAIFQRGGSRSSPGVSVHRQRGQSESKPRYSGEHDQGLAGQ